MATSGDLPAAAVGLGFRVEVAADLLRDPAVADFVEVVAESCFASPAAHREAVAIARMWPVVPHGVKLSLGSAEGIDEGRAKKLGALARELGAPAISEHVAFTRAGGRDIGHLTQLPLTRETVRVVARNVAAARRHLPDVPFYLENPAWTFRWPDDEMDEATFFHEIVAATGCELLLDVGNLHANAVNAGADPREVLGRYPLDRVRMVHVAGGYREDGFYFDTHAHAVPEPVFALLAELCARIGPRPVVLERDDDFPPFAELREELRRCREILAAAPPKELPRASRAPASRAAPDAAATRAMAEKQARVADMLTSLAEPAAEEMRPFGERAILRTREVLRHKRVDDALPLLTNLVPHRPALRALARERLRTAPRAPTFTGVADAIRIAEAACEEPEMMGAARIDLLLLRARFLGPEGDGSLRARVAPFVGRERLGDGSTIWALKGPGGSADVRVVHRR